MTRIRNVDEIRTELHKRLDQLAELEKRVTDLLASQSPPKSPSTETLAKSHSDSTQPRQ